MLVPLILVALTAGRPAHLPPTPAEAFQGGEWFVEVLCSGAAPDCPDTGFIHTDRLISEAQAGAEADAISEGGCWIVPSTDPALCAAVRPVDASHKLAAGAVLGLRLRSLR